MRICCITKTDYLSHLASSLLYHMRICCITKTDEGDDSFQS